MNDDDKQLSQLFVMDSATSTTLDDDAAAAASAEEVDYSIPKWSLDWHQVHRSNKARIATIVSLIMIIDF